MDFKPSLQICPFPSPKAAVIGPWKVQERRKGRECALWDRGILQPFSLASFLQEAFPTTPSPSYDGWLITFKTVPPAGRQFMSLCWAAEGLPKWSTEREKANEPKPCSVWACVSPFLLIRAL